MQVTRQRGDAIQLIGTCLSTAGYASEMLACPYEFPISTDEVASVDLAAFYATRHDLKTSCVSVSWIRDSTAPREELLDRLSRLAAPIALLATPHRVELWSVSSPQSGRPHHRITVTDYDTLAKRTTRNDLISVLGRHAIHLFKVGKSQLSFPDADPTLLDFATQATTQILVEHFEKAVTAGRDAFSGDPEAQLDEGGAKELTRLAIRLLAARILEDKGYLNSGRSTSATALLHAANRSYGNYFAGGRIGPRNLIPVAEAIWAPLGPSVTFRSVTNEMLGHFYETALVSEEMRTALGIHYTPSGIARQMLMSLPIEALPPERRHVFDGACGSGSLLVAAHERLAGLLPASSSAREHHDYMLRHISGMDVDGFAAELAGLSLLLFSLPDGDSWNIRTGDSLGLRLADLSQRPHIIVANPPWKEERSVQGRRVQRATLFLSKFIDLLPGGGLLAILLPETFLQTISCRTARKELLETCELLELWQLPAGTFATSESEAAVIIARKRASAAAASQLWPVRVRRVRRAAEMAAFSSDASSSLSYTVAPASAHWGRGNCELLSSALDRIWSSFSASSTLGEVAELCNGIKPGKGREHCFADAKNGSSWRPWLNGSSAISPYRCSWDTQRIPKGRGRFVDYPSDLQVPQLRREAVYSGAKVLANATRSPGSPWRLFAAIDHGTGYFPEADLHCIAPKPGSQVTLEEIAAVINSPVANAWVNDMIRTRHINLPRLRRLPFPSFGAERSRLRRLVREAEAIKADPCWSESAERRLSAREIVGKIDDIVFAAYGLDAPQVLAVKSIIGGYPRPGDEWRDVDQPFRTSTTVVPRGPHWPLVGSVLDVNADEHRVLVWVRGLSEGDTPSWVSIPDNMPGWLIRPGTPFRAEVPRDQRHETRLERLCWLGFMPLGTSYLSDDQLLEQLHRLSAPHPGSSEPARVKD